MSPIVRRALWLRRKLDARRRKFLYDIDQERISSFQSFYYPMVFVAGLYLAFGADEPTRALADTLGSTAFHSWLALHFICPPATLIGRRMWRKADTAAAGEPNSGLLGARLQLLGDGGVWAAICIYVACLINTSYWGSAIYPSFYLLMGVPGGFMFTLRSWRRLRQINERARQM